MAARQGNPAVRPRIGGAVLGAAPVLCIVALLAAPGAVGAPALGRTYSAPFSGLRVKTTDYSRTVGCATGHRLTASYFNGTSGIGGFRDNASASACTGNVTSSAVRAGNLTVQFPIHFPRGGTYNLTAVWTTNLLGTVNVTGGNCTIASALGIALCESNASVYVYGSAYLYDRTTKSTVGPVTNFTGVLAFVENQTVCVGKHCKETTKSIGAPIRSTGNYSWAFHLDNETIARSSHYELVMEIYGGASAVVQEGGAKYAGFTATAELNTGTKGHFEQLVSVAYT